MIFQARELKKLNQDILKQFGNLLLASNVDIIKVTTSIKNLPSDSAI